ncbi:MAG TPA: DUF3501 family protein [Acidimicrobiales bacterium]|jgi:hypothetical protein
MSRKLLLDDISDVRAYERERAGFRAEVIATKQQRRVAIGPFVTVLFENRDTIRFQVQEMARAEKITTDAAIQAELDVYNPLIPEPGSLAATLFIELTSKDELTEWLPKLVGIEHAVELRLGDASTGDHVETIAARPDSAHQKQLTRETVTASVHYIHFDLTAEQAQHFASGSVSVGINHPNYTYISQLDEASKNALLADLHC